MDITVNTWAQRGLWLSKRCAITPAHRLQWSKSLTNTMQAFIGIQCLYYLDTTLTKTSILLLLYRIFGVCKKYRIAISISGLLVICYWVLCTTLAFTGCSPIEKNWNHLAPGHCIDFLNFLRWSGIGNVIINLLILSLPIPMIWRLTASTRQKVAISGMFALGLLYATWSRHES